MAGDVNPGPDGLTALDKEILAFEHRWWRYAGAKEQTIKDLFGLSSTAYYQRLNMLIDIPAAYEHDPMLVKRLRKLRETRSRARSRGGRL